jgi:MCP family monocarboxylic acid transporter-like MFS transporter 10
MSTSVLDLTSLEIYANVAFDGNAISEYFLCIMNGSAIFGAIV